MIPTIEQIIYDLLCGKLNESQSIGLIEQHIELARQTAEDDGLRDHFAGMAMQAAATNETGASRFTFEQRAEWAYLQADAMLKARNS